MLRSTFLVLVLCDNDRSAWSIDHAALSMDPSFAQPSIAALTMDGHVL